MLSHLMLDCVAATGRAQPHFSGFPIRLAKPADDGLKCFGNWDPTFGV